VRDPSGRREPQAFLSTNLDDKPEAILGRFVWRWRIETTFQEVRRHLGVETQRQWSDLAILRTTPVLLGLFSLVTLWAGDLMGMPPPHRIHGGHLVCQAAADLQRRHRRGPPGALVPNGIIDVPARPGDHRNSHYSAAAPGRYRRLCGLTPHIFGGSVRH
jgi:hypothetical protein